MKKYQAAAYLRLSAAGNRAAESESIENQEYIIARFVKENPDIELVSSYADSGHSGLIFDRPAFLNMMEDAKVGRINCIIVKDLSRFGRDYIETGRYLQRTLPMLGIRFIAILDHVDTLHTPPSDDIVMQIKTIINDEFSREISTRTRSSLKTMRQSGLYVGACPIYGYQKYGEFKNQLVPNSGIIPVVQRIFEMKLAGALDTRTSPGCDHVNLFSGLLICGSCGGNMTRKMIHYGDIVYRYYYCPTGKRRGCAAPVMISEDTLQEIVFNEIGQHIEKAKTLSEKIEQMTDKEILHLFTKDKLADIEDKQAQLQKLLRYKSSLKISEIRGIISAEEHKNMEKAYTCDILQLEKAIAETTTQFQALTLHIDKYIQGLLSISKLNNKDNFERNEIVSFIEQVNIFSKCKIVVVFAFDM